MRLTVGHPDYVYSPWPSHRRVAASRRAKERISGKRGHAVLYGSVLPEPLARVLRPLAYAIARKTGPTTAAAFVAEALARWRDT